MINRERYNAFVEQLDKKADGGLFFHRIEFEIYITDYNHKLLGVWNLLSGAPTAVKP